MDMGDIHPNLTTLTKLLYKLFLKTVIRHIYKKTRGRSIDGDSLLSDLQRSAQKRAFHSCFSFGGTLMGYRDFATIR